MGMGTGRVVAIWIFACVHQGPNDFDFTKLRCQGECEVAICFTGIWKEPMEFAGPAQSGGHR